MRHSSAVWQASTSTEGFTERIECFEAAPSYESKKCGTVIVEKDLEFRHERMMWRGRGG